MKCQKNYLSQQLKGLHFYELLKRIINIYVYIRFKSHAKRENDEIKKKKVAFVAGKTDSF